MLKLSICMPDSIEDCWQNLVAALPFGQPERNRLASFFCEESRLLSMSALIALSRVSDTDTESNILREEGGKPYFADREREFSLAHTDGLAIAALSDTTVGVDVEWLCDTGKTDAIAKRFFSPQEQKQIAASPDPLLEFYSLWTKKEAYSKYCGKGLASVLSDTIPPSLHFTQYIIERGDRFGIISVCHSKQEPIHILNPHQELKLYELQN